MFRLGVQNGFKIIVAVFQCFGFADVQHTTNSKIWIISLFLFYASFPVSLFVGAVNSDDKNESAVLIAVAIAITIQVVKFFLFIRNRSEFLKFSHKVDTFFAVVEDDYHQIAKKFRKFLKLINYLMVMFVVTVFLLIFYAVSGEKMLPFDMAFPLDWKNNKFGYFLAVTYLIVQSLLSFVIFLLNTIHWYLMMTFSFKYELVGNKFKYMGIIRTMLTSRMRRRLTQLEKEIYFLQDFMAAVRSYDNNRE